MSDGRGTWYLPSPTGEGTLVHGAHARGQCAGRGCALHGPSDHWARDMPLEWQWSGGQGRMLRVCPHGDRHHDPDEAEWMARRGKPVMGELSAACDCPCDCAHDLPF